MESLTYFQKRNNFSELHYLLGYGYNMFDLDFLQGRWFDIKSEKEEATYIEYRSFKKEDVFNISNFKPIALFELKYKRTEFVVKQYVEFKIGTSAWGELMFCKMTNMRFFLVMATNGSYPFVFVEFDMNGKPISRKALESNVSIKDFWRDSLCIK